MMSASLLQTLIFFVVLYVPVEGYHRLSGPLLCEACKAIITEITDDIDAHKEDTVTIQDGGRLGTDHKPVRILWRTSELRATELLEDICSRMSSWSLRQDKETNYKVLSKNYTATNSPDYYTEDERKKLRDINKDVEWTCNVVVDEYNDELVIGVKKQQTFEQLAADICNTTTSYCTADKLRASWEKEMEARAKWEKAEAKKKKKKAKEEAKRKKEEEERKKKEEEEAAAKAKLDALEAEEDTKENGDTAEQGSDQQQTEGKEDNAPQEETGGDTSVPPTIPGGGGDL